MSQTGGSHLELDIEYTLFLLHPQNHLGFVQIRFEGASFLAKLDVLHAATEHEHKSHGTDDKKFSDLGKMSIH